MASSRWIERGIRLGILGVFVAGYRRRDPGAIANALLSFVVAYSPGVVERLYGVEFHPWQRAYVETAMLTHAAGMLGPYDDVWWWDHLTHAHSATLLGGLVFAVARRRGRNPRPRVVAAVICVGLLWELLEYAIHAAAKRVGFEPVLVSYGRTDTALDLLFNLVGALLVLAIGDRFLENFVSDACGRE